MVEITDNGTIPHKKMQAKKEHLKSYQAFMHDVVRVAEPGAVFDVLVERSSTNKPYKILTPARLTVLSVVASEQCTKEDGCFVDVNIEPLDLGYSVPCNLVRYTHTIVTRNNRAVCRQLTNLYHGNRKIDMAVSIIPVGDKDPLTMYRMLRLSYLEEARMQTEMSQLRFEKEARRALFREQHPQQDNMTSRDRFLAWRSFIKDHKLDFFRTQRFNAYWAKKKATRNMILNIMYDAPPYKEKINNIAHARY